MEPFGLALSPHESLIRPFELLHYAAAQNYLLFLSSSQLIKKGKVLPSLKKCRLDERDFREQIAKAREGHIKKDVSVSLEAEGIRLCPSENGSF